MTHTIKKIRDKSFQGFYCTECGRELKHAYSVDGQGTFGSECVYKAAGIEKAKANKIVKAQNKLAETWADIIKHPSVYSLCGYIEAYGSIEAVEDVFFRKGRLQ